MPYIKGYQSSASTEFNSTRTDILNLWGTGTGDSGYGQTTNAPPAPSLPSLPATNVTGDVISGQEWLNMTAIVSRIAAHQGTTDTNPSSSLFDAGDRILGQTALASMISTVTTNRLNVNAGGTTLTTAELSSTRATAWTSAVLHEFTATFANENEARWFFNSGGQIRLSASRTDGTASTQNTDWSDLLSAVGTVMFGHTDTTQTGAGGMTSSIGYYDLTDTYQQVFTQTGSGAYASNDYTVLARRENYTGTDGGNGYTIRFQAQFNDDHTNIDFDSVDGTLTSNVGTRRATSYLTINAPSLATVTGL